MEFDVHMVVEVDPESELWEADRQFNYSVILDQVKTLMYDLDELQLKEIDVEQRK